MKRNHLRESDLEYTSDWRDYMEFLKAKKMIEMFDPPKKDDDKKKDEKKGSEAWIEKHKVGVFLYLMILHPFVAALAWSVFRKLLSIQ